MAQAGLMVGAPYVGLGGHQRGAVLAVTWPVEVGGGGQAQGQAGGEHLVPGDHGWLPGSEGSQVSGQAGGDSRGQDYQRSGASMRFATGEDGGGSRLGLVGSPTSRLCSGDCSSYSEGDVQAAGAVQVRVLL